MGKSIHHSSNFPQNLNNESLHDYDDPGWALYPEQYPVADSTTLEVAIEAAHHDLSFSWHWIYLATLTLDTPMEILERHGETVKPVTIVAGGVEKRSLAMPVMSSWESRYAVWVSVEDREVDETGREPSNSELVVCDLPDGTCEPLRYLAFLKKLRALLDGDALPREKRQALREWFTLETWNDVLVCWGGEDAFIDRMFPRFLSHLVTQGVSSKVTEQLSILGIDNRLALSRFISGKLGIDPLVDIAGLGKATLKKLEAFAVDLDWVDDTSTSPDESGSDEACLAFIRHLEDSFIQIAF